MPDGGRAQQAHVIEVVVRLPGPDLELGVEPVVGLGARVEGRGLQFHRCDPPEPGTQVLVDRVLPELDRDHEGDGVGHGGRPVEEPDGEPRPVAERRIAHHDRLPGILDRLLEGPGQEVVPDDAGPPRVDVDADAPAGRQQVEEAPLPGARLHVEDTVVPEIGQPIKRFGQEAKAAIRNRRLGVDLIQPDGAVLLPAMPNPRPDNIASGVISHAPSVGPAGSSRSHERGLNLSFTRYTLYMAKRLVATTCSDASLPRAKVSRGGQEGSAVTTQRAGRRSASLIRSRRKRQRRTPVGAPRAELPEPGSQDGKDVLVLHGVIRVAPHINRSEAKEVLDWDDERLDRALGTLRVLAQGI